MNHKERCITWLCSVPWVCLLARLIVIAVFSFKYGLHWEAVSHTEASIFGWLFAFLLLSPIAILAIFVSMAIFDISERLKYLDHKKEN